MSGGFTSTFYLGLGFVHCSFFPYTRCSCVCHSSNNNNSSDMNKAQVNFDLKRLTEEQLHEVLIQSRQELSRRYEEKKRKAKQMVQCSGKNKRKEQCRRKADPSVGYCFHHLHDKQETPNPAPRQIKEVAKPIPAPR